jgi:hypothetical protein
MRKNRREVLKILGAAGGLLAFAPLAQAGMGEVRVLKKGKVPPAPIPWDKGHCAFCNMPIKTPAQGMKGKKFPPGFFERTYAQIAFKDGKALHFESIACMVNYAYAHGIEDGADATFYVMAVDPSTVPCKPKGLIPAREATYVWGEKLMTTMKAHLVAVESPAAAAEGIKKRINKIGRYHILAWPVLWDLKPLPEVNLVPLLAKHTGLL